MRHGHLTIEDIQPEDRRFVVEVPDKNFSAERNYQTINRVIQETDKFFKSLDNDLRADKENRIDILSSYARYRFNIGTKTVDKYLGKELMGKVIGERILQKVRVLDSVQRLNRAQGNNKYMNFSLL